MDLCHLISERAARNRAAGREQLAENEKEAGRRQLAAGSEGMKCPDLVPSGGYVGL